MKYELIIKDIKSGEVVQREECDCVIGAFAGIDGEDIIAKTLHQTDAPIAACFGVLAAAQDACDDLENNLYEEFKKLMGSNAPKGMFNEFIEKLREAGSFEREGEE